jgi:D-alanyl-D-alanine carboxypeptidase
VAAVVLGAPVEAFDDAAALLNFGLLEFRRTRLVRAGEHLGTVDVAGANVPGVAASDLVLLVRNDRIGSAARVFRPLSGLLLPVELGAPIGREDVTVEGTVIGSVPVVAAAAVSGSTGPPAPVPPARLAGLTIVYQVVLGLLRALIRAFL